MNSINDMLNQEWLEVVGWTLLHCSWQILVITLVFAIGRSVLRLTFSKRSASPVYVWACLCLCISLLTPVATLFHLNSVKVASSSEAEAVSDFSCRNNGFGAGLHFLRCVRSFIVSARRVGRNRKFGRSFINTIIAVSSDDRSVFLACSALDLRRLAGFTTSISRIVECAPSKDVGPDGCT